MRAMPFLTADSSSVSVEDPRIVVGGEVFSIDEPIRRWDYQTPLRVQQAVSINETGFRTQTGMAGTNDLYGVVVALQVDCAATSWRHVSTSPIQAFFGTGSSIEALVPAGAVAISLTITSWVLLDRPDREAAGDRVAHLRGSRLFSADAVWRVPLEGNGAGFPTDAVDFAAVGLPAGAPWNLVVRVNDLDIPFMKAVRLQINTGHPAAASLLAGDDPRIAESLFHDVLVQMLFAVRELVVSDYSAVWAEESVGDVLNNLCDTYAGCSLFQTCEQLTHEPAQFLTQLKAGLNFLKGKQK